MNVTKNKLKHKVITHLLESKEDALRNPLTELREKGTETLAYKTSVMNGLVSTIKLHQRTLSMPEKEKIDNLQYGLEFKLNSLLEESKMKEVNLKIESMQEVIKILKNNTYNL